MIGESMQNITTSGDVSESKQGKKKKSRKKRKSARSFVGADDVLAAPLLGPKLLVDGWNASATASEVVRCIFECVYQDIVADHNGRKYCSLSEVTILLSKQR
jgi:hypothetical protein